MVAVVAHTLIMLAMVAYMFVAPKPTDCKYCRDGGGLLAGSNPLEKIPKMTVNTVP